MSKYLGEFPVDVSKHPVYSKYTPADWAMEFIGRYSGIDGSHHKMWVFDQVARVLKGTKVIVVEARWSSGTKEIRFWTTRRPSAEYKKWVKEMTTGENEGYDYDEGIAP